MKYRQKLIVIAILPVVLIALAVFFIFERQSNRLITQQSALIEEAILEQKRNELRNYLALAERAIAPSYNSVLKTRRRAQAEANEILRKMSASRDQYFFVYDGDGQIIVEPRMTWFVGKNWSRLQDREGRFIIQETIEASKEEDAFVSYVWQKPSTKDYTQKLVHSTYFPKWNWVVGTGIYLDDIDRQVETVQAELRRGFDQTRRYLIYLGLGAILFTSLILTIFQFSQQRLANAELRRLNERLNVIQEDERKRVASELHDGISQVLISTKYGLEAALLGNLTKAKMKQVARANLGLIDRAISEVRRISRALRPTVLDDMGLAAALKTLCREFESNTKITTREKVEPVKNLLSEDAKTALYRVAQEALSNIAKHAEANEVELSLHPKGSNIILSIRDDGIGFDPNTSEHQAGLGLRNISERIDRFDGRFKMRTRPGAGCILTASLPIESDQSKRSI